MPKRFKTAGFALLLFAIVLRVFFYLWAAKTKTQNLFLLPITPGQDFFQIINGAYTFLRGGDFQGSLGLTKNPYINCCGVNNNVYHPFFTLLVGTPLQILPPWQAFHFWLTFHFLTDIFIAYYLVRNFKHHRLLIPSLILFLISNYGFYEIWNNQFHFLFNLFTFLLMTRLLKEKDTWSGGIYFFLGLLVKPIGILWIVPLLVGKYFKTLFLGLGGFILISLPFYFYPEGKYYFSNLFISVFQSHFPDWNIFFAFDFIGLSINNIGVLKFSLLGFLFALSLIKTKKQFIPILLLIMYQLSIYQSSYPYQYSILVVIIPLGILNSEIDFGFLTKIALTILTIPAPLFLFRVTRMYQFLDNQNLWEKFIFILWGNLGIGLLTLILIKTQAITVVRKISSTRRNEIKG